MLRSASQLTQRVVVVIGGGLAGLTAALSAVDAGARVILLDAGHAIPSGASLYASSGMSAAVDAEDVEPFAKDLLRSAGGVEHAPHARTLALGSVANRDWLVTHGAPFLSRAVLTGGHSRARTFLPAVEALPPTMTVGTALSRALAASAERKHVVLRPSTRVASLLPASNGCGVAGVILEGAAGEIVNATAVVIATGGFGASRDLLPARFKRAPYSCAASADGSGLRLAIGAGAALVGMEDEVSVQLHPTSFLSRAKQSVWSDTENPEHLFIAPEAMRGAGAVLLDSNSGMRFVNELTRRDELSAAVLARTPKTALLVICAADAASAPGAAFHEHAGRLTRVEGTHGLHTLLASNVKEGDAVPSVEALTATVDAIAAAAARGGPDSLGRVWPSEPASWKGAAHATLLAGHVTPAIHYTLGGVAIDAHGRVLNARGERVPGLYAAGEVTGGVHGNNRLAGAALCETIVFGRAAGEAAATDGA
jgi:FAD-dependent fumarate reductase